jgi:putative FmdB family regulatory protein
VPVYEYACMDCKQVVDVLMRRVTDDAEARCPQCGGTNTRRLISGFAFHRSWLSKLEQLDPKYDKMIDASNPDLAFDKLVKKYKLDEPAPKARKKD